MKRRLFFLVLLFCSGFLGNSCSKDESETIPYVYVNFLIEPNNTLYYKLNVIGGWEYLIGGYNGIVVFRLSQDEFVAYDRACPYDYKNGCRVDVESSNVTLIDSCCNSHFIYTDGSPYQGPVHVSLKYYKTSYDGNYLRITN